MVLWCFRSRNDDEVENANEGQMKKVGVMSKCDDDEVEEGRGMTKAASIRILHFNDVYTINNEEGKPGGAARFASVLRERASGSAGAGGDDAMTTTGEALVLFSGDVFSPSLEGNLFKVRDLT